LRIPALRSVGGFYDLFRLRESSPSPGWGAGASGSLPEEDEEESMKRVEAYIKPFKISEVQEALIKIGVQGMTLTEVKGFGRQKGHVELYRGAEYQVNFVPKLLVIAVVPDVLADQAVDAIQKAAVTGKIGDGKIFVSRIDEAVRIRTKETGPEAL